MSKKAFKSQASSSRAATGLATSTFGAVASSPLSYVYEPPDLSNLSDPNIGVAFKNIQKKDGTTKAKALEDLQDYLSSTQDQHNGPEDAILEAWIKVYPRTSIDTSRRVRQLAHSVQGHIAQACGKRIAKHLPSVVPSWLSGSFDNDKTVTRAADASFHRVFSSEGKRASVWSLYQSSIIEYSIDIIMKESPTTLSDERTTSPDDASAKYSRVVGAAVMLITHILENNSVADVEKGNALLAVFFNEDKVWKLTIHQDPFVRRALYRLLIVTLSKKKDLLDPSVLSANVLTSGLHSDQAGSALDFAKAIHVLSQNIPDVWTAHYTGTGKKSAQNRLAYFLKKGSRGGPPEFWSHISSLLHNLPSLFLASIETDGHDNERDDEVKTVSPLLRALREGIHNKDEGRLNHGPAWATYLLAFELVQTSLPESVNRPNFYNQNLFPILRQYITPSTEQSVWTVLGHQQELVCLKACRIAMSKESKLFEEEWKVLSTKIIEDFKVSQPEQSKEYGKSQNLILAKTEKWYQLHASLLGEQGSESMYSVVEQFVWSEITSALEVVKNRNGKPYGVAAAIHNGLQSVPHIMLGFSATRDALTGFANDVIPGLLLTPSSKYLIGTLDLLGNNGDVSQAFERCVKKLQEAPDSDAKSIALQALLSSPHLANAGSLDTVVMRHLYQALKNDDDSSWRLVATAIGNPLAPKYLTEDVLVVMVDSLSVSSQTLAGLHGLELVIKQKESIIKDFALSQKAQSLLSSLLSFSKSSDETVAERAKGLSVFVERAMLGNGDSNQATQSIVAVIRNGINNAAEDSLPVDILVGQAQKLVAQAPEDDMADLASQVLPDLTQWNTVIEPFCVIVPNPSLAITNILGGAVSAISLPSIQVGSQNITRDKDGFSAAFRMTWYTTKLINTTNVCIYLTGEHKAVICRSMCLFLQLANDNLSINGVVPLWHSTDPDQEAGIMDIVSETQEIVTSWLYSERTFSDLVPIVQRQLLKDANGMTTMSYYSARAYTAISTQLTDSHGQSGSDVKADYLKGTRKSPNIFASAACLTGAPESKELQRVRNELLADLTDHRFSDHLEEGLHKLVLFGCTVHDAEDHIAMIPQQRLVFFVKHAIEQLKLLQPASVTGGQIVSVLVDVLPQIKDIYGEFWADILDYIEGAGLSTSGEESLFGIHACLRLLWLLRKQHMQEANDDLLEAWNERKAAIGAALVTLMTQLADIPDDSHQPQRTINEMLARQLTSLSSEDLKFETKTLYPLIASESTALQQGAYELLHNRIPSAQEQTSIDKALSADYIAQIPQELLSLILTGPTVEFLAESNFERTIPYTLRSYLLSWRLTFDHWQNASYKVQIDYLTALQEGAYVQDFLNVAFNVLINGRTKPIDASKFEIETYTPRMEESPERETHWLFIHLYYLCLRHLPSITKTWWRDSTSRQVNLAVSTWTEKHISPLIISSELSTITSWAPTQSTADQPMTIKVSPTAREITASIPIDEQTMTIAVHLPKSYPLARAEVTSVHRVAVAEKKWNFWLINAQGVINFSSGGAGEGNAIIDGLMAWRKNVTAAMKGQTECAICYSVVGADRQLPSKKCQTCKNTFHSSCLFRWFKSSNSSSCPLCRNAFNYS